MDIKDPAEIEKFKESTAYIHEVKIKGRKKPRKHASSTAAHVPDQPQSHDGPEKKRETLHPQQVNNYVGSGPSSPSMADGIPISPTGSRYGKAGRLQFGSCGNVSISPGAISSPAARRLEGKIDIIVSDLAELGRRNAEATNRIREIKQTLTSIAGMILQRKNSTSEESCGGLTRRNSKEMKSLVEDIEKDHYSSKGSGPEDDDD